MAHTNLIKVQLFVILVLPEHHLHMVQVLVVMLDPTYHHTTAITAQQAHIPVPVHLLAFSVHQDHTAASGKRNAPHAEQERIKAQAYRAAA